MIDCIVNFPLLFFFIVFPCMFTIFTLLDEMNEVADRMSISVVLICVAFILALSYPAYESIRQNNNKSLESEEKILVVYKDSKAFIELDGRMLNITSYEQKNFKSDYVIVRMIPKDSIRVLFGLFSNTTSMIKSISEDTN